MRDTPEVDPAMETMGRRAIILGMASAKGTSRVASVLAQGNQ
jgi:hypothetical protein